jgi:hypothetical protein
MDEQLTAREPEPEAEPASRWEDYIDVFFSPADLFRRRAHDRVAPPLVTLLILGLVLYFVMLPANAIVMRAALADNPEGLQMVERMGLAMQVLGSIVVPFTYAFMVAAAATLLWFIGRLADIRTDFSRTALIATYAAFVLLLSQLIVGALVLIHGEAGLDPVRHLSLGVLRFTGQDGIPPELLALLRRVDLVNIWQAVLWATGIRVIYGVGWARAAFVAGATWLLFAVPGVVMGALGIGQGLGG